MAYLICKVCGGLYQTNSGRCPCRTTTARGYGSDHRKQRAEAIRMRPVCVRCGHRARSNGYCDDGMCKRCPLQYDHVDPMNGTGQSQSDERQILCAVCNRAKSNTTA